ncbi:hypothetical protein C0J52_14419 [Blattella germanica]|nr:hypothetical protein C0J52_14419 [Blattella germanica]
MDNTRVHTNSVTGHGRNKAHLQRIGVTTDATCLCMRAPQTVDHLLYHCAMLKEVRKTLKTENQKAGGTWPVTQAELIKRHLNQYIQSIVYDKM